MAPHIFPRQKNFATTNNIAGGLIAGFICLVVLLWLCLLRFLRSLKADKERTEVSVTSFGAKGVGRPRTTEADSLSTSVPSFSRRRLRASIVMPQKSITHKPSSHGLLDKAAASSWLGPSTPSPTLSRHRPLSNASGSPRPRAMSILNPACSRHSRSSSGFTTCAQYSILPGSDTRPSSTISASSTQARSVRQLFEPALPDELALVRHGESLTVLQSFDDGWCLVARDTPRPSRNSRSSRLSSWMKNSSDNVDIGLVPAWVFVKPLKGITVTRPFRGASVNALDLGQHPAPAHARDAIISWSNFA